MATYIRQSTLRELALDIIACEPDANKQARRAFLADKAKQDGRSVPIRLDARCRLLMLVQALRR